MLHLGEKFLHFWAGPIDCSKDAHWNLDSVLSNSKSLLEVKQHTNGERSPSRAMSIKDYTVQYIVAKGTVAQFWFTMADE